MNELTLLDLECIVNERKNFNIELNEKKINVSQEWLWKKIHSEKIDIAEIYEEEFAYIRFESQEELVLFFD